MADPQQQTFTDVQPIQAAQTFSNVTPLGKKDYWGSPADEVGDFLAKNPGYQFLDADPKFPNRKPGIYPTGPGNEWRNDPNLNERKGSPDQWPIDLHSAQHTYEGVKAGAMAATAPLAMEATIPKLVGGVVGGTVGSVAGSRVAKAAGGDQFTQEFGGDLGGILGGILTGSASEAAVSKARAIYGALPEGLQKEVLGVASPRLRHAMRLWDTLEELKAHAPQQQQPGPELDATGENRPFAGESAPRPMRWDAYDATGENKPFAGGMDERTAKPSAVPAPAPIPAPMQPSLQVPQAAALGSIPIPKPMVAPAAEPAPGAAGSIVRSVTKTTPDAILARLRTIAQNIEAENQSAAAAKPKAAAADDEDLTSLLLESLSRVRKARQIQ